MKKLLLILGIITAAVLWLLTPVALAKNPSHTCEYLSSTAKSIHAKRTEGSFGKQKYVNYTSPTVSLHRDILCTVMVSRVQNYKLPLALVKCYGPRKTFLAADKKAKPYIRVGTKLYGDSYSNKYSKKRFKIIILFDVPKDISFKPAWYVNLAGIEYQTPGSTVVKDMLYWMYYWSKCG